MRKINLALGAFFGSIRFVVADCGKLDTLFPGKVFFESSETYDASVSSYFSLQGRLTPTCILRPEKPEDVALAVKTLAEDRLAHFAIRSGGHSPYRGFSNINDGVTIDLRSMNDVCLSKDRKIVRVQSGAIWGEVYPLLEKSGLSAVGGRAGTVGVGGFLTGGGIAAYSRRRGWGCDSVSNFEVVLASGKIVNANARQNRDLFTALKGGQNNFGVVTRMDLTPHKQEPFAGGVVVYPKQTNEAVFRAFAEYMNRTTADLEEAAEISFTYYGADKSYSTTLNAFHSGSNRKLGALKRWESIQPQISSTLRTSNMSNFAQEIDDGQGLNKFNIYGTTAFRISPTIMSKVYGLWETSTKDTFSRIHAMNSALIVQPTPSVPKAGQNSLGFPSDARPETDVVIVLIFNNWDAESDSKAIEDRTMQLIREIDTLAIKEQVAERFRYLNYATSKQLVFEGYGQSSLETLRKVARRYDPQAVFQRQVNGGFKLL